MKNIGNKLSKFIKNQLDVPSTDPDEYRRSRLLNIFLVGFSILSIIAFVAASIATVILSPTEGVLLGLVAGVVAAVFSIIILLINRYASGRAARSLFLLFLIIILVFSDIPEEVASGRTLIAFTIPIILASVLFPPYASFIAATAVSAAIVGVALYADIVPNPFAIITFYMIALASWLAGRSMERAMRDLRVLNEELDQRVQDRTKELAESERREHMLAVRNNTILQSIADGVLVFDTNQNVIMANPAANHLAERKLESLSLPKFLSTIEDSVRGTIENWLDGHRPEDINHVRFEWQDRTISASIAPVTLPNEDQGEETVSNGNVMVLRDFTREAQLERAKNLFLGMVSHELRTPMSAIQGYVSVLLASEKERLSEAGREYLQTISISIKQLVQLANELIDLSRMEIGEIDLYPQWTDMDTLVQNSARIVKQEYESRDLSLDINIEPELPELYIDQNRLNQVLLNLLSNAYKYTPQGGATIEVTQSDEWINIAVKDTGLGIKADDQEKMFERFFRASDKSVQKISGVGLGLNISKGLIELHGGNLAFESKYGVGTTFIVALPKNNPLYEDENDIEI